MKKDLKVSKNLNTKNLNSNNKKVENTIQNDVFVSKPFLNIVYEVLEVQNDLAEDKKLVKEIHKDKIENLNVEEVLKVNHL